MKNLFQFKILSYCFILISLVFRVSLADQICPDTYGKLEGQLNLRSQEAVTILIDVKYGKPQVATKSFEGPVQLRAQMLLSQGEQLVVKAKAACLQIKATNKNGSLLWFPRADDQGGIKAQEGDKAQEGPLPPVEEGNPKQGNGGQEGGKIKGTAGDMVALSIKACNRKGGYPTNFGKRIPEQNQKAPTEWIVKNEVLDVVDKTGDFSVSGELYLDFWRVPSSKVRSYILKPAPEKLVFGDRGETGYVKMRPGRTVEIKVPAGKYFTLSGAMGVQKMRIGAPGPKHYISVPLCAMIE